jgi:hypothetical protein
LGLTIASLRDNGRFAAYEVLPHFVIGFHGCDEATAESVLRSNATHLKPSTGDYEWLGHGIYFWENSPKRATEWAQYRKSTGHIRTPAVVGAVIDLGRCLNLFDANATDELAAAYQGLHDDVAKLGGKLPRNVGKTSDYPARRLDCAVMQYLHAQRLASTGESYRSVRGPFLEGKAAYPGAGFKARTHIQLCVRDTSAIKGYFRPLAE